MILRCFKLDDFKLSQEILTMFYLFPNILYTDMDILREITMFMYKDMTQLVIYKVIKLK